MQNSYIIKTLIALSVLLITYPVFSLNIYSPIIISEIMPNPKGDDNLYEWIEIENTSNTIIDLNKWTINDKNLSETINPNSFLILCRNKIEFEKKYNINCLEIKFSLTNSKGELILKNIDNQYIDNFNYESSKEDISFEKLIGECNKIDYSLNGNSLNLKNNSCENNNLNNITDNNFSEEIINISIIGVCPNPQKSNQEFIKFYNSNHFTVNLKDWYIIDNSNKKEYFSINIEKLSYYEFKNTKLILNNDNDIIKLYDNLDRLIYTYRYDSSTKNLCTTMSDNSSDLKNVITVFPSNNRVNLVIESEKYTPATLMIPKLYLIDFKIRKYNYKLVKSITISLFNTPNSHLSNSDKIA